MYYVTSVGDKRQYKSHLVFVIFQSHIRSRLTIAQLNTKLFQIAAIIKMKFLLGSEYFIEICFKEFGGFVMNTWEHDIIDCSSYHASTLWEVSLGDASIIFHYIIIAPAVTCVSSLSWVVFSIYFQACHCIIQVPKKSKIKLYLGHVIVWLMVAASSCTFSSFYLAYATKIN